MPGSALARVAFGLLVLATVGAFFVTQRLKRSDPVVKQIRLQLVISPNGDGRKDTAAVGFELPERDDVTVAIVDEDGDEVRRLANARPLRAGEHGFTWDGRTGSGRVAPDGEYFVRVTLRDQGRSATGPRGIVLTTAPPRARLLSVTPARVRPSRRPTPVRIAFEGPASPPPLFRVYRAEGDRATEVARFQGERNARVGVWDGRVRGRPAPAGTYAFSVTVQSKALVSGSAPRRLPPTRDGAAERTGLTIAGTELQGPLEPVRAGAPVRIRVLGGRRRFAWIIARLGASRPLRRGRAAGRTLSFRVPSRARTGVHLVRVDAGGRPARLPIAVRGRGGAAGRVLVVLPAITWQGRNPVDGDADGFADTLDDSEAVALGRPFARGSLPVGFADEIGPLLRHLDRHKLPYDLTTDLGLARRRGPGLAGRSGVALAGGERWLTEQANAGLRDYVERGGRVAVFGADSLRRRVALSGARLVGPSAPERTNVFGEEIRPLTIAAAPLVVNEDRLALFRGSDGFIGLFESFEQSEGLVSGAEVLTRAGREPDKPAFAGYRLGEGVVVRVGAPGWSAALAGRPEVARATARLWALLSR